MIRYGVFRLGQIWTVTGDRGARLGFVSREAALAALATMVAVHRAAREDVTVAVQDERGSLRTLLNPLDMDALEGPANDAAWDALLGMEIRQLGAEPPGGAETDDGWRD
jgi:hypothetical protein